MGKVSSPGLRRRGRSAALPPGSARRYPTFGLWFARCDESLTGRKHATRATFRLVELREGAVQANGLDFAYLSAGDSGPLALCLHGFPDSAWGWRYLLPALADSGYRAVAPWMRGYAPTSVPTDGVYQTGALVRDACALHDALDGDGDAVLIGHDWGAITAYGAASFAPDRWRRVVTAAVPPPGSMGLSFLTYDQLRRSFYMFFFQSPLADLAV